MSSRIEQMIDEIEEYIGNCKYQAFSKTNIIVDKDELEELLAELRQKTPEEIRRYQKIISNKEAILNDAKERAQALIDEATEHTTELINEHEIMQQAYAQANEVVQLATRQAQEIVDNAALEANAMRDSMAQYVDDLMGQIEEILSHGMEVANTNYNSLYQQLTNLNEIVVTNRAELRAQNEPEESSAGSAGSGSVSKPGEDADGAGSRR